MSVWNLSMYVCAQRCVFCQSCAKWGYGFCICYCEDASPRCLPVFPSHPTPPDPPMPVWQVTWALWVVSHPIISCDWLSGHIRVPRESNADELRQLYSDWEGSSGPSTICKHHPLLHVHTHTHTSKQTHRLTVESKLHSNSLLAPPCKFSVYACVTVSLQYKYESHQKA